MKRAFLSFLLLFVSGASVALDENIRNLPGKYSKSFNAYVEFTSIANNHAIFAVHTFFDLSNMCHIEGEAFLMESDRANFKNDDCTLIFDFAKDYSAVKITSKYCKKTCDGKVSNLVNGLYERQ